MSYNKFFEMIGVVVFAFGVVSVINWLGSRLSFLDEKYKEHQKKEYKSVKK